MQRDLIGYGDDYPKIRWPDDSRVALNIVLAYEEGAEMCIGDGDPTGERVGEFTYPSMDNQTRDLGIESTFEYGSRVGARRMLRLLDAYGFKCTVLACGRAMERNPVLARSFTAAGHEVAGHGYRWEDHFRMGIDEEREVIRKTVQAIQETSGERPVGWYCRYSPSENTRPLLVEEGGFLYDSDSYADELPYWVRVNGKKHLVVPYQLDCSDAKFFRGQGWSNGGQFWEYLRDSVNLCLKEGKTEPKMLSVGFHGRIIGRPGRASALERFLEFCQATPGIWVARRDEIARWWYEHYP
ncbi:MAG: polysaccharide deacetylase family protein [SAR324 cluster bacterium]|nr:polysaccharide deacetylase family protein [SAR324 cluster bacterium]